jgi:hypothetical protein
MVKKSRATPEKAMSYSFTAGTPSERSTYYGVITWITNIVGLLLSAVPLALPLGGLLLVISLVTGFMGVYYGVVGYRGSEEGTDARRDAKIGLWLGLVHLVFFFGTLFLLIAALKYSGVLPS